MILIFSTEHDHHHWFKQHEARFREIKFCESKWIDLGDSYRFCMSKNIWCASLPQCAIAPNSVTQVTKYSCPFKRQHQVLQDGAMPRCLSPLPPWGVGVTQCWPLTQWLLHVLIYQRFWSSLPSPPHHKQQKMQQHQTKLFASLQEHLPSRPLELRASRRVQVSRWGRLWRMHSLQREQWVVRKNHIHPFTD